MKRSTTVCIAYCGGEVNAGSMNVAILGNLLVKVESIVFDASEEWKLNDGDTSFMATMQDKEFLGRIQEEKIRIGPNDILEIELEKHQLIKNNRQIGKTENIVKKGTTIYQSRIEIKKQT